MRDKILFSAVFGFAIGILARSFFVFGVQPIFFMMLFSGALLAPFFIFKKLKNYFLIAAIFIFAFSLGALRFHLVEMRMGDPEFEKLIGQKIKITGIIDEDPEEREKYERLIVRPAESEAKILVTADLGGRYKYGDELEVSGKLTKPENFITDNGKLFDYEHYLAKDGIYYEINFAKVEILSRGHGNKIKRVLFNLKNNFSEKISALVHEPESALLGGLLLGGKRALGEDLNRDLIRTGTIHVVALSGFNVTIVAEAIMKFFRLMFSQLASIGLGIFSIILFTIMVGAGSTVIRAAIMAALALIARATGRTYDAVRALFLAGFLMILFNPMILAFDVSFQLSFLATIGIIYVSPRMAKYFRWLPKKFLGLQDIAATTAAAYIFVLPFLIYKMGVLSLVAFPANIMILPFIPATMLFGFLTDIIGFISKILAWPFAAISYGMLHYELGVIKWFADLPFAAFQINHFPLFLTLLIYAIYFYVWFRPKLPQNSLQ